MKERDFYDILQVGDVSQGIVKAITDKDAPGRTYDLVG